MSIDIPFSERDWERIKQDWAAWWARELDRPMVMIETSHWTLMPGEVWSREFLFEKPADQVIDFFQNYLEKQRFYGDALPKWFPNFGPGITAGFLGADVGCKPNERTVWFDVQDRKPIEKLEFKFEPDNPWWLRVKELTLKAAERWGNRISVGHTDLGGNLDILSSFLTANQLLADLYDAPEQVLGLASEITKTWLRYYDQLHDIIKHSGRGTSGWAEIWSPGRTYMFQSDLSYMISPKMFEQFVAPDLHTCFKAMDHSFYHLDGKGQIVHLDILLAMEDLDGIQWIPGAGQPPPEQWMPLLKRIKDRGKLCQVYVTAEGARKIVREIGGKGFALYVIPFPAMSENQAQDFLKVLAGEDISRG